MTTITQWEAARLGMFDGAPAKTEDPFHSVDSLRNEGTTGGIDGEGSIPCGWAVAKGAADDGCKPVGSDDDQIAGITTKPPEKSSSSALDAVHRSGRMVGVLRFGDIRARPAEAVRAGDQVLALVACAGQLGGTGSGAVGPGRLIVRGARWLTTTSTNELGTVEVLGRG